MRKLKKGRARRYRERLRRMMYVSSVHEVRFYAAMDRMLAEMNADLNVVFLFDRVKPK